MQNILNQYGNQYANTQINETNSRPFRDAVSKRNKMSKCNTYAYPVPPFYVKTDPDSRIDDQKWQNLQLKNIKFFGPKITIYSSLGLHEVRPSHRRSFRASKENI